MGNNRIELKANYHEEDKVYRGVDHFAIKQSETGVSVAEVCRKMGISEATFYNWKKRYGGLGVSELRKLRQLEENTVLFKVADNGVGIPAKYHDTLFDKFTKARRPGIKGEASVGLGMSIIKTIVDWHNGEIWFESEQNQGSTFYIRLPRK